MRTKHFHSKRIIVAQISTNQRQVLLRNKFRAALKKRLMELTQGWIKVAEDAVGNVIGPYANLGEKEKTHRLI